MGLRDWGNDFEQVARELDLRLEKGIDDPTMPAMGVFNLDTAIDWCGNIISALTAYMYLDKRENSQESDPFAVCTGAVASRLDANARTGLATGVYVRYSKGTSNVEARH
ncbi:hypothetical protein F4677DRAFT_442117 [Hypoxylon crocopeplum]|nr:hypothetical protein F4677DRAFT_442117 [Hypoxylon crocopeplum]